MDTIFSDDLKELVTQSRETAISLGYDYISTIHFFIADCESKTENSIFKFAFKNLDEFSKFKQDYTLPKIDLLAFINESIPLTKEAENTLRLTASVINQHKQAIVYPSHFFISALTNKNSLLSNCFSQDEQALEKLITFYENLGEFKRSRLPEEQIKNQYYIPAPKNSQPLLAKLRNLLKSK